MKFDLDFAGFGEGVFTSDQISNEEYHKIKAVSSHGIMQAMESMQHFKHYVWGEKEEESKDSLDYGKVMHMAVLEQELFRGKVIDSRIPRKNLKAYKDIVKANPNKIVLSSKESKKIESMLNSISENTAVMNALTGGKTEITILIRHPEYGLPLKGRLDFIGSDYLLDYKTAESSKPSRFMRNAESYKYHVQAAFYLYLCQLAKIDAKYYAIIAQESSAPYVCTFFQYPMASLEKGRELVDTMLQVISDAYKHNRYLGYTDTVEELHLSSWSLEYEPNYNISKRSK